MIHLSNKKKSSRVFNTFTNYSIRTLRSQNIQFKKCFGSLLCHIMKLKNNSQSSNLKHIQFSTFTKAPLLEGR